jgi:hypothetical protein
VRAAAEARPRRREADVRLVLFRLVDAHRDRQHVDLAVVVALLDVPCDRGRPVDRLVVQREAVHEDVRQVHRADVRDVGQAGPAVDQREVVVLPHVRAQRVEELPAAEPLVEVVPVDRGHRRRVVAVLTAGGDEVKHPAPGKLPGQRDGVRDDLRALPDPVGRAVTALGGVPRVVGDQLDDALGGGHLRRVEEGVKVAVQAGRVEVPVHDEHLQPVAREDPRDVGQSHGAPRAALERVEGDDLACAVRLVSHERAPGMSAGPRWSCGRVSFRPPVRLVQPWRQVGRR